MSASVETVRVVCREESHQGEEVLVDEFHLVGGDWLTTLDELHGDVRTARGRRSTSRALDADDRVVERAPTGEEDLAGAVVRTRHDLLCPSCGLDPEVRGEVLAPILRTLADHGAGEVTLRLLGVLVADEAARRGTRHPHRQ